MHEVQLVTGPLAALMRRVRELLEEFPDNPLLGQLLQLASRIQGALLLFGRLGQRSHGPLSSIATTCQLLPVLASRRRWPAASCFLFCCLAGPDRQLPSTCKGYCCCSAMRWCVQACQLAAPSRRRRQASSCCSAAHSCGRQQRLAMCPSRLSCSLSAHWLPGAAWLEYVRMLLYESQLFRALGAVQHARFSGVWACCSSRSWTAAAPSATALESGAALPSALLPVRPATLCHNVRQLKR